MKNTIQLLAFLFFLNWACRKPSEPMPAIPTYLPISMYYFYNELTDTASAIDATYYEYDNQNRLISIIQKTNRVHQLRKEVHHYGLDGNLKQIVYAYEDSTGNLKNATKIDLFYNGGGKLSYINNGYTDSANGQDIIREQFRYSYDAFGKLIERYDTVYTPIYSCIQKERWRKYTYKMSDSSYKFLTVINDFCFPPFIAYDGEVFFTSRYKNPFHFVKEYIPDLVLGIARYSNYPTYNYRGFYFQQKRLQGNTAYLRTNTILQFKSGSDMPEVIRADDKEVSTGITSSYYYYFVYKKI